MDEFRQGVVRTAPETNHTETQTSTGYLIGIMHGREWRSGCGLDRLVDEQ
jgi:hypothetical protein